MSSIGSISFKYTRDDLPMLAYIKVTSDVTGISCKALRQGCKDGTIPHIRVGEGKNARFMILLPKYIEQLNKQAEG